jgi:predicted transposase YbfD/YdcC
MEWKKLQSVVKVQAERRVGQDKSVEERYYLSSLAGDAERTLEGNRTHWQIENGLPCVSLVQNQETFSGTARWSS